MIREDPPKNDAAEKKIGFPIHKTERISAYPIPIQVLSGLQIDLFISKFENRSNSGEGEFLADGQGRYGDLAHPEFSATSGRGLRFFPAPPAVLGWGGPRVPGACNPGRSSRWPDPRGLHLSTTMHQFHFVKIT